MEPIISDMLQRFERGRLSRRELVQGLSMLVAAGPAAAADSVGAKAPAVTATHIDHVSVLVSDLARSAKFYRTLFGLSVLSEDEEHGILRLGNQRVVISIRKEQPYGTVDHFGVAVARIAKGDATQALQQHGLAPAENWQYGFYIKDPDGVNVQLMV